MLPYMILLCSLGYSQDSYHIYQSEIRAKGSTKKIIDADIIELPSRENIVQSAQDGTFRIELSADAEGLLIRAKGFEDVEIKKDPITGELPKLKNILLEPAPELEGVTIIRARRKTEISQQSLQREEMQRIPGTGGDVVRSLQTLPSVLPAGGVGGANIVVRGSGSNDNQFYFDRFELPFVFHLGGLGTVIPTRMLEGIDLYAGGFSAIYGNATGAIVQLRSENFVPSRQSGQFELGLAQSSFYLEGPTNSDDPDNAIGYRLGLRRTYLEVFKPIIKKATENSGGLAFTVLPQATDYQFVLNGKHDKGTWQAFLFGASNKIAAEIATRLADDKDGISKVGINNYFQVSGLRWNENLGNGWGLSISPQQRFVKVDNEFFDNQAFIKSHKFWLDAALDKRVTKDLNFTLGVRPEFELIRTEVDSILLPPGGFDPFTDVESLPRNVENRDYKDPAYSVYIDAIYKPFDQLSLNPGIIYQKGSRENQSEFDPRIAARYSLTNEIIVKGSTGYYSQKPLPQFSAQDFGNPELKMERAIHYVAGFEYQINEAWDADIQIYHKELFNFVGSATKKPEKKYENNVLGKAKGIELLLKKQRLGRWSGWASYGYSISERRDPRTQEWSLFDNDRTHSLNILGSYKVTGSWELGSRLNYLTGSLYTKIPGGEFNHNTGQFRPIAQGTKKNNARLPNYFRADIRSDYDVLYDSWKLNYYIEVQNITLYKNVSFARNSEDFSSQEFVYDLPILPLAGVIASF